MTMEDLVKLFLSFLKVGSLSFGGAYSLLPVIENETVVHHGWLSSEEFLKVLSMVEIIPGAISIKFATYTGYKVAGVPGVIAANLGNLTAPVVLISLAAYFYNYIESHEYIKSALSGVKFAILGMILAIVYQYTVKSYNDWLGLFFLAAGFVLTVFFKMNPVYIVGITGFAAIVIYKIRLL
jgi:chromate transporter